MSLQRCSGQKLWKFEILTRLRRVDWLIDRLIIYSFTSRSRIVHLYGNVTIAGEGLQNLGLCSALRVLEQGGIFIVPNLMWQGASVFPVSSEGPPPHSPLRTRKGMWRIYSNPDLRRAEQKKKDNAECRENALNPSKDRTMHPLFSKKFIKLNINFTVQFKSVISNKYKSTHLLSCRSPQGLKTHHQKPQRRG
jgi:hypothetical protein